MKGNGFAALVVALTLVLGFGGLALADTGALADFNARYPGNAYGNSCTICHSSIPNTNPYGTDLVGEGATADNIPPATFAAVEGLDSDGDGFTNIQEINAGKFPGDATSRPGASITITAPVTAQVIPSGGLLPFTILYDAPPEVSSVKVRYSLNGGATWLPAAGTPGAGSFDWNVPTPVKNSSKTLVQVIGFNAANKRVGVGRSARFTIEVVSITAPAPDETVTGGGVYSVTWATNGTKGTVANATVFYTVGSSGIWKPAKGSVVDPLGSFSWNVPSPAKAKIVKLKVVLKDGLGVTVGNAVSKAFLVQ